MWGSNEPIERSSRIERLESLEHYPWEGVRELSWAPVNFCKSNFIKEQIWFLFRFGAFWPHGATLPSHMDPALMPSAMSPFIRNQTNSFPDLRLSVYTK